MNIFTTLFHKIAAWAGSHANAIQAGVSLAQTAVSDAVLVATAAGVKASVVATLSGVASGLSKVSATVQAETSASTLTEHAQNLSNLASSLMVASNDLGIKDLQTKLAIGSVIGKIVTVVGALETATMPKPAAA